MAFILGLPTLVVALGMRIMRVYLWSTGLVLVIGSFSLLGLASLYFVDPFAATFGNDHPATPQQAAEAIVTAERRAYFLVCAGTLSGVFGSALLTITRRKMTPGSTTKND